MRNRTSVALVASALTLMAVAAPATAAPKKFSSCHPKGTTTLAASAAGRVYERRGGVAYSCSYRTGKRVRVGNSFECGNGPRAYQFRFARRLLGFVEYRCGIDTGDQNLRVIDLWTGRTKWRAGPIDSDYGPTIVSSTRIADWGMRSNGSLAWIGERYPFDEDDAPNQYQVWKLESASPRSPQKLDEGGAIDPRSLALGRRGKQAPVYWRKAGTIFSATLR